MFLGIPAIAVAENPAVPQEISHMAAVLIVDDETLIRWSVAESLESAGFRVAEAGTAREALQFFLTCPHDHCVVLLDLKLPDSSDLGLLRRILEVAPGTRVILMTAHGTPEVLEEALHLGAFSVLNKPFDMTLIVDRVREASAAA
jgi:DNA-binding NtrC family response regulator